MTGCLPLQGHSVDSQAKSLQYNFYMYYLPQLYNVKVGQKPLLSTFSRHTGCTCVANIASCLHSWIAFYGMKHSTLHMSGSCHLLYSF